DRPEISVEPLQLQHRLQLPERNLVEVLLQPKRHRCSRRTRTRVPPTRPVEQGGSFAIVRVPVGNWFEQFRCLIERAALQERNADVELVGGVTILIINGPAQIVHARPRTGLALRRSKSTADRVSL